MVTFEEMTEVPGRDEVMPGVNRLLGFFLSLFIDFYHVCHTKGHCFAGKDARHDVHEVCVYCT